MGKNNMSPNTEEGRHNNVRQVHEGPLQSIIVKQIWNNAYEETSSLNYPLLFHSREKQCMLKADNTGK